MVFCILLDCEFAMLSAFFIFGVIVWLGCFCFSFVCVVIWVGCALAWLFVFGFD